MTFSSKLSAPCKGDTPVDTSLTSLNWLINLRLDLVSPEVSISPIPEEDEIMLRKLSPNKEFDSAVGVSLTPVRKCLLQCAEFSRAPRKYRTDSSRPPYSDTALIYLAIKHSRTGRVTLSEVFKWIRVNFKFYRLADHPWEVSERECTRMWGGSGILRFKPDACVVNSVWIAQACSLWYIHWIVFK